MFGMRMWGIYESKPLYGPLLVVGFLLWAISMLMTELTVLEYIISGILMLIALCLLTEEWRKRAINGEKEETTHQKR